MQQRDEYGYPLWHGTYPGWNTGRFSAAVVKVKSSQSKMANLVPDPGIITDLETAKLVTGHEYTICFGDKLHYGVGDATENVMMKTWVEYNQQKISDIPGVTLGVEWAPRREIPFS